MPQNSGRDYKARPVDVAQPLMAGGPVGGNQGGDFVVQPVAFALRGREGGAMPEVEGDGLSVGTLRAANGGSSRDYVAFDTTQITSAINRSNPRPGDPCHPLAAGAHAPAVAFNWQGGGTQTTLGYDEGSSTAGTLAAHQTPAIAGSAVRRLTPRECERLQGFADDYTLIPAYARKVAKDVEEQTLRYIMSANPGMTEDEGRRWASHPDGPRYKALGNSMAVPVMAWIGQRIALVDAIAAEPLHSSRQAHEGRAEGEIRMNPESSERNAA
jgi:DNA (cytosine-5)-methyltransferase 1